MKRKERMRKQTSRLVSYKTTRWSQSMLMAFLYVYVIPDEC